MATQYDFATVEMYNMTCCNCGIPFGVPNDFDERRRQDSKSFTCPRGHSQSYNNGENKRLKDQLERERKRREWAERHAEQLVASNTKKDHRIRSLKGVVTKQKKRAAAGLCPCCNRTFQNLARHMHTKHPDY